MASVTVDIDIDEFDLEEILDGVEYKWDSHRHKDSNRKEIREFFKDLIDQGVDTPTRQRSTVIDELKMSVVMDGLDSKSLTELQEFFN